MGRFVLDGIIWLLRSTTLSLLKSSAHPGVLSREQVAFQRVPCGVWQGACRWEW